MKRIFVTGGSSPLGLQVIGLMSGRAQLSALVHKRPIDLPGVELQRVEGSLDRIELHADAIRAADIVLHMAAITHADDPARYTALNVDATRRLASILHPGQRIVFVSSICAHPEAGAYGVSKLEAEDAIKSSTASWTIIRPAEIYGSKSGEGIDALVNMARRFRLIPDFRSHGSIAYAPISLDEAAAFIAAATLDAKPGSHTYTLCAGRSVTARDIATATGALALPVPVGFLRLLAALPLPLPFKRDQIDRMTAPRNFDSTAAEADHGFAPRPFLESLRANS